MGFASIHKIAAVTLPLLTLALPARAAERALSPESANDYARACDAYGAGYFSVPGSDLCLQLGGAAIGQLELRSLPRAAIAPRAGSAPETAAPAAETALVGALGLGAALDARLATEAGLVSGHVAALAGYAGSGDPRGSSHPSGLDQAWLRWAGWTVGRAQSNFDFYADAWNYSPLRGSNARTEQIAFTFAPAPGVAATLALENSRERRNLVGETANPAASAGYAAGGAPDLVGALRVENPFGVAQLSGAAHELRTRYAAPASVAPGQPDAATSSQWGFAAQGGLKVNLPSLSDADAMILQATYARGASAYVSGDSQASFGGVDDPAHPGIANPRLASSPGLSVYNYDCVSGAQPFGHCDASSGYALVAALKHYWSPTVSSSLFASFFGMNYTDAAKAPAPGAAGVGNYRETQVGGNLSWTPLKNLMVGGEVTYGLGKAAPAQPNGAAGDKWSAASEWSGRIRVQQNF